MIFLVVSMLVGKIIPDTCDAFTCLDDLVLYSRNPESRLSLNSNGVACSTESSLNFSAHVKIASEAPQGFRDYLVDLESAFSCYDGDTCTFDVTLPSVGQYGYSSTQWDYGLGVIITKPTGLDPNQPWTLPIAKRRAQHVRLCDINAPELHPGPNKKAIKARDALFGWLQSAKQIIIRVPQDAHGDQYEKYGRLLGYLIADGVNLNAKQLTQGNAKPFIKCEPSQSQ